MSIFTHFVSNQKASNDFSLDLSASSLIDALLSVKSRQNLSSVAMGEKSDASYTWSM